MSSFGSPSPFFLAGKKAYEVERSLRFNSSDSAYLQRTPSSAGNRQICTFSCWVKRSNLDTTNCLASAYSANNNSDNISMNLRELGSGNCEFLRSNDETCQWDESCFSGYCDIEFEQCTDNPICSQ